MASKSRQSDPPPIQTATVQTPGWRWSVVEKWRALLAQENQVPWDALDGFDGATLLKGNALRRVWRVRSGDQVMVAKEFLAVRGWGQLKSLLLGPGGRGEFRSALYGLQHGLETVRPIAFGRPTAGAKATSILLTEEIPDTQSLSDYWLGSANTSREGALARDNRTTVRLATFLEKLHRARFIPTDLHPQNILVTRDEGFVVVDLHKCRCGTPPNQVLRILNLADLNQWFGRHARRTMRLRFLLAYLTCAFEQPSPRLVRKYVSEISEVTGWKTEALEKKRDKRIFGDNQYFGVLSLPDDWSAHVFLQAKRPLAGSLCSVLRFDKSDWAAALECLPAKEISENPEELQVGAQVLPVRIERSADNSKTLRNRWLEAHRKINRHQRAVLPLALLQRRRQRSPRETILITERSEQS